jgi:hypothetical protein
MKPRPKKRKCLNCGKTPPLFHNYCNWDCSVEHAKKNGGTVHCPNGLPVLCIRADGLMLEHEHGDHPDYKFPVNVRYLGKEFEPWDVEHAVFGRKLTAKERKRSRDETHALIYTDGSIALTLYETSYAMWYLRDGTIAGGSMWKKGEWRLTQASRNKIAKFLRGPKK